MLLQNFVSLKCVPINNGIFHMCINLATKWKLGCYTFSIAHFYHKCFFKHLKAMYKMCCNEGS